MKHPRQQLHYGFLLWGLAFSSPSVLAQNITAIWANDGGDKVTQDELRATRDASSVKNTLWNGDTLMLFGSRNEVVGCNFILEAGRAPASNVSVSFQRLDGPSGSSMVSFAAQGDGIFNWTQRPIELFYVRYLQIRGLSRFPYESYDERHVPKRFQRPWTGEGVASGTWQNRPDHDKYYPDIAIPIELVPTFNIAGGKNQSIWVDIFIPKDTTPGIYKGHFTVRENGTEVKTIPVRLRVCNLTLPDMRSAKTLLYFSSSNLTKR